MAAAIYEIAFSMGTSFLYAHKYIGYDSDIFLTLGKFMNHGMIPYKDFFDHKGPVIIFIEWLGYIIGGKNGVLLLQIFFLTATLLAIYKIVRLDFETRKSLLLTIGSLLIFHMYFDKGNLTEEYCLPFLMWSFYFFVKRWKEDIYRINFTLTFFSGITFMIGTFTRLTNSLPLVIIIIVEIVRLTYRKQWKEIIKGIEGFLCGIAVVTVPILIYFWKTDAIGEMIYATFTYNFKHGLERNILSHREIIHLIVLAIPFIVLLIAGSITLLDKIKKKDKKIVKEAAVVLLNIAALIVILISRPYAHYLLVWIPAVLIGTGLVKPMISRRKVLSIGMIIAILIASLTKASMTVIDIYFTFDNSYVTVFEKEANEINTVIRTQDYLLEDRRKLSESTVFSYDVNAYFYLITDIVPCYKNYILQDLHTSVDDIEKKEFESDLKSMKAKYVVTSISDGIYQNYIETYYDPIYEGDILRLFIRIEN